MLPTILIVDDHADIRRLLRVTLGNAFTVLEAADGVAAMAVIHSQCPQLVLLDVMMPGELDGLQVLDAIKADDRFKDMVVAMMTARGQMVDIEDAHRRGADAYFVKPFSPLQVASWARDKARSFVRAFDPDKAA